MTDAAKITFQERLARRNQKERALIDAIHQRKEDLEKLLQETQSHWGYEDPIYRFYHQSWKVFFLQSLTESIVNLLRELQPECELNCWFLEIIAAGTNREFNDATNENWQAETRPILEAFFHTKYFLEMICRYEAEINEPPQILPSGWASVLYLYGLR